ncbi:MAG: radical SAM protein, partial [Gammaproteobacteria bacterium]|nr:radical SAM protein [Gammaproteobacteria bacterium]MDD9854913.1 radical SAM protein [Gammaproteobacteria bacterium]
MKQPAHTAAHAVPAATHQPAKGRAALSNREGRFESLSREAEDDGWGDFDLPVAACKTTVHDDVSRTVIS